MTMDLQAPVPDAAPPRDLVASTRHFIGFLLIGAGVATLGVLAQHAPSADPAAPGQLAPHGQAMRVYLSAICMDWAMLYYCWTGVRAHGGRFESIAGARWRSAADVLADIAIAIPFWLAWEAAAYGLAWLLGPSAAKTVDALLPHSPLEVLAWTATCITAGVCEEIGFRGYVLRQLQGLTGSTALAVVGQGLVFGLFHLYQGWKNAVAIALLGMIYGLLALWRGNLRVNILSHAMTDFWEGWLKFVVWP